MDPAINNIYKIVDVFGMLLIITQPGFGDKY